MRSFKELHNKYSILKLIKKFDDRYGFQAIVRMLYSHWFNPFATIYVNFFSFPFFQAIKFPILIYGNPKLYSLVGNMKVLGNIKTGMIIFNKTVPLNPSFEAVNSEMINLGTIIFHGGARIGCGSKILVQKNAILELGDNAVIGDQVNIGCHYKVTLGDNCRIAHRSQIQESNHHFIFDKNTRSVNTCTKPISIGSSCWICNSCTITSGVSIPNHCIVASNSLVNAKREIANAPSGCIIGGIPAKILSTEGKYRIFNRDLEGKLFLWFAEHPSAIYNVPENIKLEELINL